MYSYRAWFETDRTIPIVAINDEEAWQTAKSIASKKDLKLLSLDKIFDTESNNTAWWRFTSTTIGNLPANCDHEWKELHLFTSVERTCTKCGKKEIQ